MRDDDLRSFDWYWQQPHQQKTIAEKREERTRVLYKSACKYIVVIGGEYEQAYLNALQNGNSREIESAENALIEFTVRCALAKNQGRNAVIRFCWSYMAHRMPMAHR